MVYPAGYTTVVGDWNGDGDDTDRYLPQWCILPDGTATAAGMMLTSVFDYGIPGDIP